MIAFCFAALIFLTSILAFFGTPRGSSYLFNLSWFVAFEAALGEGVFYPRHLPALWFDLGGLDFFFYGPLPFYVAAGPARWLCQACDPQTVFGLTGGLLWSLSAVTFWAFARRFVGPMAAMASAGVYMLLPYHIGIDWIMRQAVGEFAAYVFLPLIARGMDVAMRDRRLGLSLPLGVAGTLLCHLPTALLAAHVFGAIGLVWACLNLREAGAAIARIAGMGAIGAALAGLYWMPALVLVGDVSQEALYTDHFQPQNWLFFGTPWIPPHPTELYLMVAGLVGVAIFAVSIAVVYARSNDGVDRHGLLVWAVVPIVLCVFLNTVLSRPIWDHWIIARVQFPVRLMVFVDMATALAAGYLCTALVRAGSIRQGWAPASALAILLLSMVSLARPHMQWAMGWGYENRGRVVEMVGVPEYLPPALYDSIARTPEAENVDSLHGVSGEVLAKWSARVDDPGFGIAAVDRAPREWLFQPEAAGAAVLAVPYWRHMRAETEGGAEIALAPDPDHGMVALDVPPGASEIRLTLPWQPSERIGLWLSLAGLAGLALLVWRRTRPG